MRKSICNLCIVIMLSCLKLDAQNLPLHYFRHINPISSNPSIAALDEKSNITVANYNLWAGGFKPVHDYLLSFSTPVEFKKSRRASYTQPRVGIGASLLHEKVGPFNQSMLQLIYSFHIPMSSNMVLSLGIAGIIENISIDVNSLSPSLPDDPRLSTGNNNALLFDGGFGASISGKSFILSISGLNLTPGTFSFKSTDAEDIPEYRKFFVSSSYSFELSKRHFVQPSITIRNTFEDKISYDASISYHLDNLSFGIGYRGENTLFAFTRISFDDFIISYTSENPLSSTHMIGNGHTFSLGWSIGKESPCPTF